MWTDRKFERKIPAPRCSGAKQIKKRSPDQLFLCVELFENRKKINLLDIHEQGFGAIFFLAEPGEASREMCGLGFLFAPKKTEFVLILGGLKCIIIIINFA